MNELITTEQEIKSMIHEVRGKQVMLDSDLARLYQCKNGTKSINLAVKRNIDKFPERYCFQLNRDEYYYILRFQNETLELKQGEYNKYLPYAFTEEGVAMLATVLRTPIASKISIAIMDAFVAMRHFILENKDIYLSLNNINNKLEHQSQKLLEHDDKIDEIFSRFDKEDFKEKIFFDGQIYDAYSKILDIMNLAKKELIIIDSYVDKSILDMIAKIKVDVLLITKNNTDLKSIDINKYNSQYNNLTIKYDNSFHDRFLILDKKKVYHLGASINYAGKRTFAINRLQDKEVINALINKVGGII